MDYLKAVKEFHSAFDHPILPNPAIPSENRSALRVSLLQEELNELKDAIAAGDIVEAADAFADIQYVLAGAILEFGLQDKFPALFAEVHRSNMSKACVDRKEAIDTIAKYQEEGVEGYHTTKDIFDSNGNYTHTVLLVKRSADDKLLKSINYSPADLVKILNTPTANV